MGVHILDDFCVYCIAELASGVPDDGKCGHEELREKDRARNLARVGAQTNKLGDEK